MDRFYMVEGIDREGRHCLMGFKATSAEAQELAKIHLRQMPNKYHHMEVLRIDGTSLDDFLSEVWESTSGEQQSGARMLAGLNEPRKVWCYQTFHNKLGGM